MKRIVLMLVMLGLLLTGCVRSVDYSYERNRTFLCSFDTVWRSTMSVLTDREEPISAIEKESGIIVTDFVLFYEGHFDKTVLPMGALEIIKQGRYKLNIVVQEVEGKTLVRVRAHIEKLSKAFMENYYTWKPVQSGGLIENEILEQIAAECSHS